MGVAILFSLSPGRGEGKGEGWKVSVYTKSPFIKKRHDGCRETPLATPEKPASARV